MRLRINSKQGLLQVRDILHFHIPWDKTALVYLLFSIATVWTPCKISNFHFCQDAMDILRWFEKQRLAKIYISGDTVEIFPEKLPNPDIRPIAKLRSSIILSGGLLGRLGVWWKVIFDNPGGCNFSHRPIDRHLELLETFWGYIKEEHGHITCEQASKIGTSILFSCSVRNFGPSVGVTIHALLCAVFHQWQTTLTEIAIEPAVITVLKYLEQVFWNNVFTIDENKRTALISWGSSVRMPSSSVELPVDISYLTTVVTLCACTDKIGIVENLHLNTDILRLYEDIVNMEQVQNRAWLLRPRSILRKKTEIICEGWPWFPTDSGPFMTTLYAIKNMTLVLKDTIYASRSSHVDSLRQLGITNIVANNNTTTTFTWKQNCSSVTGVTVPANDIRAWAAVLIAGLTVGTNVTVDGFEQILRGYGNLIEQLQENWFDLHIEDFWHEIDKSPFNSKYSRFPSFEWRQIQPENWNSIRKVGLIGTCDALSIQKALPLIWDALVFPLWEHLFNPIVVQYELERILKIKDDWRSNIMEASVWWEKVFVDPIRFWEISRTKEELINKMHEVDGRILESLRQLDEICIFLGFDEIWKNEKNWFTYNRVPHELARDWKVALSPCHLSFLDLQTTFMNIQNLLVKINPSVRLVLAVSPIPNNYSHRSNQNDYLSGKYKMASSAREYCEKNDSRYFDFFEQIDRESRHMQPYFKVWQADWRHLSKDAIVRTAKKLALFLWYRTKETFGLDFSINTVDSEGRIIWKH